MIEPEKYRKPDGEPITWFMVDVTPNGWANPKHSGVIKERITPEEIVEMTNLIKEFIKLCPDNVALNKYFSKHGKQIRCEGMDPTLAFNVRRQLMTYIVEATGPHFWIESFRNK